MKISSNTNNRLIGSKGFYLRANKVDAMGLAQKGGEIEEERSKD
jgi:hypothetical protein